MKNLKHIIQVQEMPLPSKLIYFNEQMTAKLAEESTCTHESLTYSSATVTGTNNAECRRCGMILIPKDTKESNLKTTLVPLTKNYKLFDYIWSSVIEEGGDGDFVIGFMNQDYKNVSDEFKYWLNIKPGKFIKEIKEDHVLFYSNQEYFVFTDKENFNNIPNHGPRLLTW